MSKLEQSDRLALLLNEFVRYEYSHEETGKVEVEFIESILNLIGIPLQLIPTGSATEHMKLDHRYNASDFDCMIISKNVVIRQDALVYNQTFPCHVKIQLDDILRQKLSEQQLYCTKQTHLPTIFLKHMLFLKSNVFMNIINLMRYTILGTERRIVLSETSVGFQLRILHTVHPYTLPRTVVSAMEMLNNVIGRVLEHFNSSTTINQQAIMELIDGISDVSNNDVRDDPGYEDEQFSLGRRSYIDWIPSLPVERWPDVAKEWPDRQRTWPDKKVVKSIIDQGIHVIVKPLPIDPNEEYDFRLSFSLAEIKLSEAMNEIQRMTMIILKACSRFVDSACLKSYHFKTALYWVSEKEKASYWKLENLIMCVSSVAGSLLDSVKSKQLPHYFIPKMNLFAGFTADEFEDMVSKLRDIVADPIACVEGYIKDDSDHAATVSDRKKEDKIILEDMRKQASLGCDYFKEILKKLVKSVSDQISASMNTEMNYQLIGHIVKLRSILKHRARLQDDQSGFNAGMDQIIRKTIGNPTPNGLLEALLSAVAIYFKQIFHPTSTP